MPVFLGVAPSTPPLQATVSTACLPFRATSRIESRTVLSYLGITTGDRFSQMDIDNSLKALYATGFFADVKIEISGSTLIVHVVENPIISRVAFEGNDRIETKDLEKRTRTAATLGLFARQGTKRRQSASSISIAIAGAITPRLNSKVIKLDQNRVDLVYAKSAKA